MAMYKRMSRVFPIAVVPFVLGVAPHMSWAGKHEAEEAEFAVAELFFELNNADGDLGIHVLIDGDAWKKLQIEDKREREILDVTVKGRTRQGLTEIFLKTPRRRLMNYRRKNSFADFRPECMKSRERLGTALSDEDPYVREAAADALGHIGDEAGRQALEQALADTEKEVREAAIKAFVEIGGDASALSLSNALLDTDASLHEEAVDALGEIGGATAERLLQQALADEQNSVRVAAAEWLAEWQRYE